MNFKTAKKKLFLQKKPDLIFRASNFRLTAKKFSSFPDFFRSVGTGVPTLLKEKKEKASPQDQLFIFYSFLSIQ
jgi:hypothetical protein